MLFEKLPPISPSTLFCNNFDFLYAVTVLPEKDQHGFEILDVEGQARMRMLTKLKDFQILRLDRTSEQTIEIPGSEVYEDGPCLEFWDPISTVLYKRHVFDSYYISLKNRADNEVHHFFVNVRTKKIKHWIYYDRIGNASRISFCGSRSIINLSSVSAYDQKDRRILKLDLKAQFDSILQMAHELRDDPTRLEA